jgi:uncharacterized protein (TIGR02145 family)
MSNALLLPLAGSRSYKKGTLQNTGTNAYYWSSNLDSDEKFSYTMLFSTTISPSYKTASANGYSVRCFKDVPLT